MRLINTQYNENNQAISTLWVNDNGEYLLERNGVFRNIAETIKPNIVELTQDQISRLKEQYKNEMVSLPVENVDERLILNPILNPKKILGDEVINKIR